MTTDDGLEQRVARIETRHAVDDVHRAHVSARLASIEDTLKWLMRLVIGTVVLAAIGIVLQQTVSLV